MYAGLNGCLLLAGFGKKTSAVHLGTTSLGKIPAAVEQVVEHASPQAHYTLAGIQTDDEINQKLLTQVKRALDKHGVENIELSCQPFGSLVFIDPFEGKLHVFKRRA